MFHLISFSLFFLRDFSEIVIVLGSIDSIVECLWSVLELTIVHVEVKRDTGEHGHDSFVEEGQEKAGSHPRDKGNNDNWSDNRSNFIPFLIKLHDLDEGKAIDGGNRGFSKEREDFGNRVSKEELSSMLQVHEESIPCRAYK